MQLILKKDGEVVRTEEVGVNSNENGVYEGMLMNLEPDTYNIFIKGFAHLQKKFENVTLNEGKNTKDWSGAELLTGDANGDNVVNIQDFGKLVESYLKGSSTTDFNLDGQTNIQDFRFIAENYLKRGDE